MLAGALPDTVAELHARRMPTGSTVVHADALHRDRAARPAADRPRGQPALQRLGARSCCASSSSSRRLRAMLVMVQLEVAERLAARPGSRTYGVPSVKAAWYADVRLAGLGVAQRVLAGAQRRLRAGRADPPRAAGHDRDPRGGLRAASTRRSPSAARPCGPRWPAGPARRPPAEEALRGRRRRPAHPRRAARRRGVRGASPPRSSPHGARTPRCLGWAHDLSPDLVTRLGDRPRAGQGQPRAARRPTSRRRLPRACPPSSTP